MTYEASKYIPNKQPYPCDEYESDCQKCPEDINTANLPPHCGYCGYVREDHETGE